MKPKTSFTIDSDSAELRLDLFIANTYTSISRTKIQKSIDNGDIILNGKHAKKRTILKDGDCVTIDEDSFTKQNEINLEPQDIPLSIVYEDEYFVAINKKAGMVVHPGSGNSDKTLVNAILYHLDSISTGSANDRPGIVHRLDKNTSGIILIAKNDEAHNALAALFANRTIKKEYLGICIGRYPKEHDIIDMPIGRKKNDPLRYCVSDNGKNAITEYTLLSYKSGMSLHRFQLHTGRTHQIRVHCKHMGFPIVQDSLYGGDRKKIQQLQPMDRRFAYLIYKCFERHALHAHKISFTHPFTQKEMALEAPLPLDFKEVVAMFDL